MFQPTYIGTISITPQYRPRLVVGILVIVLSNREMRLACHPGVSLYINGHGEMQNACQWVYLPLFTSAVLCIPKCIRYFRQFRHKPTYIHVI